MDIIEEKTTGKGKNEEKPKFVVRTPTDIQRIKLKKLMDNPQKEVIIPRSASARRDDKDSYGDTPSFVRNVMGSSAGAGSGEFHVYRHLRRKEYARQKQIQQKSVQEELDDAFQKKLEENRLKSEAKTAKKRAKRMKRKHRVKNKKPNNPTSSDSQANDSDSDEAESDNEGEKLSTENEEKTMETQPKKAVEEKEESKSDQQTESGNDKDQSDE